MLVEYGRLGHVGRFPAEPTLARETTVVVRTPRGVELGRVLRPAAAGAVAGEFLRLAGPDDFARAGANAARAEAIHAQASALCGDSPVAVVDCEWPLGGAAVLHVLPFAACDLDGILHRLANEFSTPVRVLDVSERPEPVASGCGSGGCGSSGGCTSCSSGGCSRKQAQSPAELTDYFAGLRAQMDGRAAARLPLG